MAKRNDMNQITSLYGGSVEDDRRRPRANKETSASRPTSGQGDRPDGRDRYLSGRSQQASRPRAAQQGAQRPARQQANRTSEQRVRRDEDAQRAGQQTRRTTQRPASSTQRPASSTQRPAPSAQRPTASTRATRSQDSRAAAAPRTAWPRPQTHSAQPRNAEAPRPRRSVQSGGLPAQRPTRSAEKPRIAHEPEAQAGEVKNPLAGLVASARGLGARVSQAAAGKRPSARPRVDGSDAESAVAKQEASPVLPTVFLAVIAALLVLGLALPDATYSETEKRNLQTFPALTWSSFTDGSFQDSFQTYIEDQFPLRDAWVSLKSVVSTAMGQVENNGVYRCSDGTLILDFVEPEEDTATQGVVEFAQTHPDLQIYAMVAPTAAGIEKDKLPAQVVMPDQQAYLQNIEKQFSDAGVQVVDLWDTFMAKKDADLYYHTDHHWTTYGAHLAYLSLANALGINATSKTYNDLVMTSDFTGSLAAEGGYLLSSGEDLHVYLRSDQDVPCIVTYVSEKTKSASPYVSSALDTRDAYEVFFGGNHPLIQIDSYAENSKGTLLVVKDSYANSLIPFLIGDYERIIVVDPRYYTDNLETLISSNSVTDVLFLYNATTFAQDTSLKRLVDAGQSLSEVAAAVEDGVATQDGEGESA